MTWVAGSVVIVIAAMLGVLVAVRNVVREIVPTLKALGGFRPGVEPALVRVRTETDVARQRLANRES